MLFPVYDVDRRFYAEKLAGFLPRQIIDFHAHVWLKAFDLGGERSVRGPTWPARVADENAVDDLLETYRLLLPGHEVTPLLLGWPERTVDQERNAAYIADAMRGRGLPGLLVSLPEWPADELVRRVRAGGFAGLKPYLNLAPPHIPSAEITIYDFLPHHHLEAADAHGWIVLLHIPRPGRLRDPLNLAQMIEIERRYPRVKLVIAHIGRAYCPQDIGDAFDVLRATGRLCFDFSANTNAWVMQRALEAVGPRRILFGSDLPIVRMRMRRICENGFYVNLVPPGLYGDVSDDPHMREVGPDEAAQLSFFLYEELYAFRCAAEAVGLGAAEVADVFYGNAARLLGW
ncbi:MAG: amidohydrolase [Anaerolineae bacterium]|nr:amidohydrolase [Anaerolineae bacterium]